MKAARQGDQHACADLGPNIDSDLKIIEGSPNITINGLPAARVGDKVSCRLALESPTIAQGSPCVLFNGRPAARMGDQIQKGGSIQEGSGNVFIGDEGTLFTIGDNVKFSIGDGCMFYINTPPPTDAMQKAQEKALAEFEKAKAAAKAVTNKILAALQEGYAIEKSEIGNFANESLSDEINDVLAPLGPEVGALGSMEEAQGAVKAASAAKKIEKCKEEVSEEIVAARKAVAEDFYRKAGFSQGNTDKHIQGIDFSKPVSVKTLPAGKKLQQLQVPGEPQGNYYSEIGEKATNLGINPNGVSILDDNIYAKQPFMYETTKDVDILESTTAPIVDDFSIDGDAYQTEGGSIQYFTTDQSAFKEIKP